MLRGTTLLRHAYSMPSPALYRERPAEFHIDRCNVRSSAYSGGRSTSEAECESCSPRIRSLKNGRSEAFSITVRHSLYMLIRKYASETFEKKRPFLSFIPFLPVNRPHFFLSTSHGVIMPINAPSAVPPFVTNSAAIRFFSRRSNAACASGSVVSGVIKANCSKV